MPDVQEVPEEAAQALGQLLQAYGDAAGLTTRDTIATARRDRLRNALEGAGTTVSAQTASVLADGMASGHLVVTEGYLYLINDGSVGVKARCSCSSGKGKCQVSISFGTVICVAPYGSACKTCQWSLGQGISVAGRARMANVREAGAQFAGQLPRGVAAAISGLADLTYPVVDRVSLREQRETRKERNQLVSRLSFPLLTLPDALDRLLATVGQPECCTVNQLQLAVGDYPQWLTKNLANALGTGAVEVDGKARTVTARTKPTSGGTEINVICSCLAKPEPDAKCAIGYQPDVLTCVSQGCGLCWMVVKLPSALLTGLGAGFAPW